MDDQREARGARRLAESLLARPDAADCERCLDEIEAYVAAQLASDDYAARFPAVAEHLDRCVACAESYALLYEALAAPAPEPATIPAPDLSFLEPGATGPLSPDQLRRRRAAARLRDLLQGALSRAGAALRVQLSAPLLAAAAALRSDAPAPALRSGEAAPLYTIEIEEPGPGVERLELVAYPAAGDPASCALRVQLALVGREWPDLAGVTVMLRGPGFERRLSTDAWGEASAAGIPLAALPELTLEVQI